MPAKIWNTPTFSNHLCTMCKVLGQGVHIVSFIELILLNEYYHRSVRIENSNLLLQPVRMNFESHLNTLWPGWSRLCQVSDCCYIIIICHFSLLCMTYFIYMFQNYAYCHNMQYCIIYALCGTYILWYTDI